MIEYSVECYGEISQQSPFVTIYRWLAQLPQPLFRQCLCTLSVTYAHLHLRVHACACVCAHAFICVLRLLVCAHLQPGKIQTVLVSFIMREVMMLVHILFLDGRRSHCKDCCLCAAWCCARGCGLLERRPGFLKRPEARCQKQCDRISCHVVRTCLFGS